MGFRPGHQHVSILFPFAGLRGLVGLLCMGAAIGAAQEMNLGPHDIGGRGCLACHVVTTDLSGNTQYAWTSGIQQTADTWSIDPNDGLSHSTRCMSCHDGNLAQMMDMGNIGSRATVNGPHPVNVAYEVKGEDYFPVRLNGSEWQLVNNPENPETHLKLFPRSSSDPTPTVQCATCHDPHNYGTGFFLRDPYDRSYTGITFCRTCHAEQSNYAVLR